MTCRERLESYLREQGVFFEVAVHPLAYTAQEVAASEHVSGYLVAKPVIVRCGERFVMAVVTAPQRLDLEKLSKVMGQPCRLAQESEFAALFPDCEVGAHPPFGNLYGLPVYVDRRLAQDPEIVFRCGSHRETMRVRYADFERLVQPVVTDLAL